ncbi:hypothetical protein HHI36_021143 [Cryptolaemus montrouzieri]|uniref:Uncharacterized protein n=1 Tax=Cryptolaemus montrouzieri TaxID=559131 RepID=A0ABD2MW17_9CUCU
MWFVLPFNGYEIRRLRRTSQAMHNSVFFRISINSRSNMKSSWSHKCITALACLGIVFLGAVLLFVWVQFYQGSFRGSPMTPRSGRRNDFPINYTVSAQIGDKSTRPRLKGPV